MRAFLMKWILNIGEFLFAYTQSTAGRFVKQYGPRAKEIAIQVAMMPGLSGTQRFAMAGELLLLEVPGVVRWLIDSAIQAGYAMYQEDLLKRDTDGDGIPDYKDLCKELGAPEGGCVTADGCPDTDCDGVADSKDKCPTQGKEVTGCVDIAGCPVPCS